MRPRISHHIGLDIQLLVVLQPHEYHLLKGYLLIYLEERNAIYPSYQLQPSPSYLKYVLPGEPQIYNLTFTELFDGNPAGT